MDHANKKYAKARDSEVNPEQHGSWGLGFDSLKLGESFYNYSDVLRDKPKEAQKECIRLAFGQNWGRIEEFVKEYGTEVFLGVDIYTHYNVHTRTNEERHGSVLLAATHWKNVEMVRRVLDAGFDDKGSMNTCCVESVNHHGDDTTILRMILDHGLDPDINTSIEGLVDVQKGTHLMNAVMDGHHINHAIALLDHGANVNRTLLDPKGVVTSALAYSVHYGRHDLCKLFLERGAIPNTSDVDLVYMNCLAVCKGDKVDFGYCSDLAHAIMATFLHLGKPDLDVVEEAHKKWSAKHNDPLIAHITKKYLQGRPFCCVVCEALRAKGRDKLLMCPCRTIAYCSRDCQVKNWKKHKDECQGALNEKGESEAIVKERKITGKGGGGKKGKKGRKKKT